MKLLTQLSTLTVKRDQSLRYSQIYQAMGVKTQAEHYRRQRLAVRRSQGLTMGAVYWHLNDVWQAPSWSSIDYKGEWKMLHYFARRFFAPLLVSPYEEAGRLVVYVLDDFYRDEPYDLLLEVKLYHYASPEPRTSLTQNIRVSSYAHAAYGANVSRLLASTSCHRNNSFFTFRLLNATENATLSANFLLLQVPRFAKDIASVTLKVTNIATFEPLQSESPLAKESANFTRKSMSPTAGGNLHSMPSTGQRVADSAGASTHEIPSTTEFQEGVAQASLRDQSEGETANTTEDKSNVHEVYLSTDGIALFVWLSAGKIRGRFSDNGFIMTERQLRVTFTSDLSVTAEQLRSNLTATCLNCLFKHHYSPMAEARA
ncbi:hypothetical protein HPB50_003811 [Hyalomma asiaticum]|uniref:Uncharacterized protein n=1 Tax=Hyalomma asiaticum TaxID=266040 RepID=A0ACB7S4X1_HYAAI|nr:hypothetical protein HPB50_003811 [Hyalomma asiaticum]